MQKPQSAAAPAGTIDARFPECAHPPNGLDRRQGVWQGLSLRSRHGVQHNRIFTTHLKNNSRLTSGASSFSRGVYGFPQTPPNDKNSSQIIDFMNKIPEAPGKVRARCSPFLAQIVTFPWLRQRFFGALKAAIPEGLWFAERYFHPETRTLTQMRRGRASQNQTNSARGIRPTGL